MNRYRHLPTYRYYPEEGYPLNLEKSVGKNLRDYKIHGNSIQDGTPTPDSPVEIESVGDYDETTGKYKIPVKVSGKNLFKTSLNKSVTVGNSTITFNDGIYKVVGTQNNSFDLHGITRNGNWLPTSYTGANDYQLTEKGGVYTLSINFISKNIITASHYFMLYTNSRNYMMSYIADMGAQYSKKIILNDDEYVKSIYLWTSSGGSIDIEFTIQLEKSSAATTHEPYIEPITTNIYLDEPLRKIGDYKDYIDFEKGIVVRNIYKQIFTGSESWGVGGPFNDIYVFRLDNSVPYTSKNALMLKSNYLNPRPHIPDDDWQTGEVRFKVNANNVNNTDKRIYMSNADYTTIDGFKEWLTELYNNRNPLYVEYVMKTHMEESIELPTIPTHKGTTIIEVDTTITPTLQVQYYK